MSICGVYHFNEIDWAFEAVGYYSSEEKALQAIAACGISKEEFYIEEIELDVPIVIED